MESCANKDGKTRPHCALSRHGSGSSTGERQRLDEDLSNLKKSIHEKDTQLLQEKNKVSENDQMLKDIRGEKEATINDRKKIDADVLALSSEMTTKRDQLMKLQGSLQYRTEEALNEAIRRLDSQLQTNHYKVSEEKKIVQEIDRLRRSKKNVKEYLQLREDLDKERDGQRMMRNQRESLHRHISNLKTKEDKIKKESAERRFQVDMLRQELDDLHAKKRNIVAEIKLLPPIITTQVKNQSVPQRRPSSIKRKESNQFSREDGSYKVCQETTSGYWKKDKVDPLVEKQRLCNTLMTYLQRLMGSYPQTPTVPTPDQPLCESTQTEIEDGGKVLVLLKKTDDDEEMLRSCKGSKKSKKDRKKLQQNKLLSHTPEMLEQFFKLEISPPSMLIDVPFCLEALSAKAQCLLAESAKTTNDGGVCESQPTCAIIENDSVQVAVIISEVENIILGLNCDNYPDSVAAVNGDSRDEDEVVAVNGIGECDENGADDGQSTQVAKVHLIKIPIEPTLNGVSSLENYNGVDVKATRSTEDQLPSLISPNEDLYEIVDKTGTPATCNGEIAISLHT